MSRNIALPGKYLRMLKRFLEGRISVKELSDIIDDRLFELRQTPDTTEEEGFLAGIELIIEEVKDGFRTEHDLTEHIKSLIQAKEPSSAASR